MSGDGDGRDRASGEAIGDPRQGPAALVARLGPHPATRASLSLCPDDDEGLAAWWALAVLLDTRRGGEEPALEALRALSALGPLAPATWAAAGPKALAATGEHAGHPRAEAVATVLWRGSRSLLDHHGGSLRALAQSCEGLDELGGRLARLAPGFGRSAVVRFLAPLRDVWPAAAELPLDGAARAAAVHLGWLAEGEDDAETGPGTLRARLAAVEAGPPLHDVEAALARLGRAACLRARVDRCPLGPDCPAR
jgi:hypothetical protein